MTPGGAWTHGEHDDTLMRDALWSRFTLQDHGDVACNLTQSWIRRGP